MHSSAPGEWADAMLALGNVMEVSIYGGCCGTDGGRMEEIVRRLALREASAAL